MIFPTLYKTSARGATQVWSIKSSDNSIITTWGQLDGKQQSTVEFITSGVNIGKSNETTSVQQAESEAKSRWEKKLKSKGYVQSLEAAKAGEVDAVVTGGCDVMLAHPYDKHKHKVKWPTAVQRKLNGHRCIAIVDRDGKCTLWSRTRKPILSMPHIVQALETSGIRNVVFDGEIYSHDFADRLQVLSSLARSSTPVDGHEQVQYHIYDIVGSGTFAQRTHQINEYFGVHDLLNPLVRVETEIAENPGHAERLHDLYVQEGYEGLVIRQLDSPYVGKRSYDLLKMKSFQDAEYKIIDVVEGRGKMAEAAIFVLQTDEGKRFDCKMRGSIDNLKRIWQAKDQYIGRMLTVRYKGVSDDQIPLFGVGLQLKEDL